MRELPVPRMRRIISLELRAAAEDLPPLEQRASAEQDYAEVVAVAEVPL